MFLCLYKNLVMCFETVNDEVVVHTNIFTHKHTHRPVWFLCDLCVCLFCPCPPRTQQPVRSVNHTCSPPCSFKHPYCLHSLAHTISGCLSARGEPAFRPLTPLFSFVYCTRCGDFIEKKSVMYLAMAHYGWGIFCCASGISEKCLITSYFMANVS